MINIKGKHKSFIFFLRFFFFKEALETTGTLWERAEVAVVNPLSAAVKTNKMIATRKTIN